MTIMVTTRWTSWRTRRWARWCHTLGKQLLTLTLASVLLSSKLSFDHHLSTYNCLSSTVEHTCTGDQINCSVPSQGSHEQDEGSKGCPGCQMPRRRRRPIHLQWSFWLSAEYQYDWIRRWLQWNLWHSFQHLPPPPPPCCPPKSLLRNWNICLCFLCWNPNTPLLYSSMLTKICMTVLSFFFVSFAKLLCVYLIGNLKLVILYLSLWSCLCVISTAKRCS